MVCVANRIIYYVFQIQSNRVAMVFMDVFQLMDHGVVINGQYLAILKLQ